MGDNPQQIEEWLQRQIREIDDAVKELLKERETFNKRLVAHRLGLVSGQAGKRKNASQKIIVESGILATLGKMKQARSRAMYKDALESFPQLKYGTFRTYICRLKERGAIVSGIGSGWWRLKPENPEEQMRKDIQEQIEKLTGRKVLEDR